MTGPGVARLDGLLNVRFPPDPARDAKASAALHCLVDTVPVRITVGGEPGFLTLMPESETFPFTEETRPSEALLPYLRDVVAALGPDAEVESTFRVQEFLGDTVREGVFVLEDGELSLAARERPARPDERPTLPEPSLSDRAETAFRRHRILLGAMAVAIVLVGFVGWQQGWWRPGASLTAGPAIDAGPLEGVVTVKRVRWSQKTILFDLLPGEGFDRFPEVAAGCSLSPGLFRVLLERNGELLPGVLVLDLRDLEKRMAEREGDDPVVARVASDESRFDRVLLCR